MFQSIVDTVKPWFQHWGYLIVLMATFVESSVVVASIFPGESILLLAGFLASPRALSHPLSLPLVIACGFAGAFTGDIVGYVIGRVAGRAIIHRFGRFILLPEKRMPVLERYFARYGRRAILFGRFAPFLRSVRTLVAGMARMPFGRFLLPDVIGAALWSGLIAGTGFLLGESWRVADRYLGAGGIVVFLLLLAAYVFTWRRVRARVERELEEQTPPDAFG